MDWNKIQEDENPFSPEEPAPHCLEVYVYDVENIKGMGVIFLFLPTHAEDAARIWGPESGPGPPLLSLLSLSPLSWLWLFGWTRPHQSPALSTPTAGN